MILLYLMIDYIILTDIFLNITYSEKNVLQNQEKYDILLIIFKRGITNAIFCA